MKSTITLLTDFGLKDPFVAQMKGVMLTINESARFVDISHEITPHHIREAAVGIGMSYGYFPRGTIHVCVVDPGVGSERRPVIASADGHYFVGPDNGVFSFVYNAAGSVEVYHITASRYFLKKAGGTFHGRDIFAPVAAWLSKGVPVSEFGGVIHDYVKIDLPSPSITDRNTIEGEIIHMDRFGNAITNIRHKDIENARKSGPSSNPGILCKGNRISLKDYYADAKDTGLYALINSNELLELFVYRGSASKEYDLHIGDNVEIVFAS